MTKYQIFRRRVNKIFVVHPNHSAIRMRCPQVDSAVGWCQEIRRASSMGYSMTVGPHNHSLVSRCVPIYICHIFLFYIGPFLKGRTGLMFRHCCHSLESIAYCLRYSDAILDRIDEGLRFNDSIDQRSAWCFLKVLFKGFICH